jgi:hypothetical protein
MASFFDPFIEIVIQALEESMSYAGQIVNVNTNQYLFAEMLTITYQSTSFLLVGLQSQTMCFPS